MRWRCTYVAVCGWILAVFLHVEKGVGRRKWGLGPGFVQPRLGEIKGVESAARCEAIMPVVTCLWTNAKEKTNALRFAAGALAMAAAAAI